MGDLSLIAPFTAGKAGELAAHGPNSDAALSLEQWQLIEALATSLNPSQARWISGYFAGLDAGLARGGSAEPAPAAPPPGRTLTILYGTETGNARDLGRALAMSAAERGLDPQLVDMADYKVRQLKDAEDVLVIVSTYGEGDPPQPAVGFFEFLEGKRAPRLDHVRFSVLALGDSTYEKYCEAGKRIDRRLEELGASRLSGRVDCDIDFEEAAARWGGSLVDLLAAGSGLSAPAAPATQAVRQQAGARAHDRKNPYASVVLENICIVGRHSTRETRHIELDLSGSALVYEPGDALGIVAQNDPLVVDRLLEATGLSGEAEIEIKGERLALSEALGSRFEIAAASPRFIDQWAKLSGSRELEALSGEADAASRTRFLHDHHVVDIIRRFPVSGIDPGALTAGLRPLQPRLYSLASSLSAVPDEAHLTIGPVRYELHGEKRSGVVSGRLADRLQAGDSLAVYIQQNPHFSLPADDAPIIMVGAGTGVAPYRGFLQELEARGARNRSWLFFGERNLRSDFLYQVEWQAWLKGGSLSRMDVAFSRDGPARTYVQHRMLEQARDIYAWLEEGAHFYVCGDEKHMARDVHRALVEIAGSQGSMGPEQAREYVGRLAADHRYQRDVY
ncbi:MAG: assimilatory sulfite reductase (NADPH) flavoprotein subunit [Sphingomonas sp.]|nr:assimilatory sulfite reductase (NADPH) flavoprotein subunit [Sphingomonas sp.]